MAALPAVRQDSRVASEALAPQNLTELMDFAKMAVKSGLLPPSIKTPEQAAIIAIKGRELGISFMQSFESLYVVNGRVGMETKLLAALLKRAGHEYRVIERTPQRAVVDLYLNGDPEPHRFEMTREEAEAARWHLQYDKEKRQWVEKDTWRTMPARMLMYRCLSSAIRLLAPECLFGMHTVDEIQDERPEPTVIEQRLREQLAEAKEEPADAEGNDLREGPAPASWARDEAKAKEFMDAASGYFGLSYPEILTALGVETIAETPLSMKEAKSAIGRWLDENVYNVDEADGAPQQGALV